MSNHFHLVLETPRANLATGMKWLLGTCIDSIYGSVPSVSELAREAGLPESERHLERVLNN